MTTTTRPAGPAGRGTEHGEDIVTTAAGEVALPITYNDASVVAAFFPVRASCARSLVEDTGFDPVSLAGRSFAGVVSYDYRETSVGSYREVGLALLVRPSSRTDAPRLRTPAWLVVDLPVTTEAANAAGREIWGYPKFVTELVHDQHRSGFNGLVRDPEGKGICSLSGDLGRGVRIPPFTFTTYTMLDGYVVRTDVKVRASLRAHRGGRLRLDVQGSAHHMADHLRMLELDGRRAQLAIAAPDMRATLPRGKIVGRLTGA